MPAPAGPPFTLAPGAAACQDRVRGPCQDPGSGTRRTMGTACTEAT